MKIIDLKNNLNIVIDTSEDVVIVGYSGGDVSVTLNIATDIEINLYGLFVIGKDERVNLKTTSNHTEGNSISRVHIKTILNDNGRFDYEGLIKVYSKSINADAYLQNENLMLSDNVSVNSSPQLEIANNLVKASHGVTTSTVDKTELEYLLSRGLDKKFATILIVKGFIEDIASMLPITKYEQIQKRLSDFF